jgi:hypothetical protein
MVLVNDLSEQRSVDAFVCAIKREEEAIAHLT